MADAAAGDAAAEQPGIWSTVMRMAVIYFVITNVMGGNKGQPTAAQQPGGPQQMADQVAAGMPANPKAVGAAVGPGGVAIPPTQNKPLFNAWPPRQQFYLRVYVTESEVFTEFNDASKLVWEEVALGYGREEELRSTRAKNITLRPSARVLRNETGLWAHIFLSKMGRSPDPAAPQHEPLCTASAHHPLVRIVKRKKPKAVRNLLSGDAIDAKDPNQVLSDEEVAEREAAPEVEWVPHWKPAMTVSIVEDFTSYPNAHAIPPQIRPSLVIDHAASRYMPVLFLNDFWLMNERLVPLNSTVDWELPLQMDFSVTTLMRWMLTEQMTQSLKDQAGMHGDDTVEEMRRMFAETSPWLLAVTALVSCLHTLFDMLAFKNDIAFWKDNKSMKGLSFKSMLLNLFFQTVIFLYLADNDTSWMILFSNGLGLAIEVWKLRKAIKSISVQKKAGARIPSLVITPADSYTMSETKIYDEEAMRYLSFAMYPAVVGYATYSLAYDSHKSWYSWLIGSTVNFVYSFGFVLMTPQLFINYKLKSTAHMPWKTLMYKSLNTFIDDLFAFIIKMPTMHRLACLRDDLIFFIYLYQRWAYGVDKTRRNEYGQVGEDPDAPPAIADEPKEGGVAAEATKPLPEPPALDAEAAAAAAALKKAE